MGDGVNIAARLEQMAEPGDILVSGSVWEQVEGKIPFSCKFMGERMVKNIARPVRAYQVAWEQSGMEGAHRGSLITAPVASDKPSIAVLPFTNLSGDAEQRYFSDGITEDIITGLSRFRSLFVVTRYSSFEYRDRAVDVKRIGR